MRILDLTTLYIDGSEGGVNTYLREKARYLSESGLHTHTAIVPGRKSETTSLYSTLVHKVKSPALPSNPQHRVFVDLRAVCALIKETRPDVVEVDCSFLLGYAARRAIGHRNVPIVGFYHVHLPMLYKRPVQNFIRRHLASRTEPMAWRYTRFCTAPCHRILVTSRDMYWRLRGHDFPPLEFLPLGVNLDLFQPWSGAGKRTIRGVNPKAPVVLFVGRLSPEKNLPLLFRTHEILHARCGSQLVIAGDGSLRSRTERFARRQPGAFFIGTCPYGEELAQLYQSADVLIVPGESETFGLIILEALASGVPVVAARRGGPAELVEPGLGELAEPNNPEDFASKVEALLGRERPPAQSYRRYVEDRYSWERMFHRLVDVYGSLREELAASSTSETAARGVAERA